MSSSQAMSRRRSFAASTTARAGRRIALPAAYPAATCGPDMPKRDHRAIGIERLRRDLPQSRDRRTPAQPRRRKALERCHRRPLCRGGRSRPPRRRRQPAARERASPSRPASEHSGATTGDCIGESLPVPQLREKGSYCRAIAYAARRTDTLLVGAGNDFDGDKGALFISRDDGETWRAAELTGPLKSTVFAIATNPRLPGRINCATKNGGVFSSTDGDNRGGIPLFPAAPATSLRSGSAEEAHPWRTPSRTSSGATKSSSS